ncbi:Dyp-type peroxidase [Streptomyces sp. DSM 44915]|uniref:Dyp-type peroxidase n=1 Tax=Streptomyces chisholmiae TaxID=3075540 RepID=A0ABU2JTX0_9ACTN|nr:Dyp-type peroxidase [Streptomyces sp. DSM 44915]MDT0268436.1 Dyp-type peroxidase [Streptomyces sp. DSM 44915]
MPHSTDPSHAPAAAGLLPAQGREPEPGPEPDGLPLRRSTEIQGDVLAGFKKDHVHLLLLTFPGRDQARSWLNQVRRRVANTRDVAEFNRDFSRARRARSGVDPARAHATWRALSFTHAGLGELVGGEPYPDVPRGTTQEAFRQGPAERAELLGDTGPSAPDRWLFGGPGQPTVHAVLTLAADRAEELAGALAEERSAAEKHGLTVTFEQPAGTLAGSLRGREHFGFKDGISQPGVRDFDEPDPDHPDQQLGKPGTRIIAPGEFLVGHPKDHRLPDWLPEWMRDGSFQVVRRLGQDVPGWWAQLGDAVAELRERGAVPAEATSEWLAARLMGRWRSGAPVAKHPDADPHADPETDADNDIAYGDDQLGRVVPLCAHLRKTNPRDGLLARLEDGEPVALQGALDGRRIIRRGVPFGERFDPTGGAENGPDAPRGLVFVAYQGDLVAQFEFIQRSWIDADDFPERAEPVGRDGVIGRDGEIAYPVHGSPDSTVRLALRQFVRTEGALYAFAPSLSALRMLAAGEVPVGGEPVDRVLAAPLVLRRGEVVSSGSARLRFEVDGDLRVRDEREEVRWEAGYTGGVAGRAEFWADGRLVLVDAENNAVWATPTEGNPGAVLVVGADGDVAVRAADGTVLWHTETAR